MQCSEIVLLLPEYSKELLSDNDKNSVKSHITKCSNCRTELEEIQDLLKFASSGIENNIMPPDGFFESVWSDLYKRIQNEGLNFEKKTLGNRINHLFEYIKPRSFQFAAGTAVVLLSVVMYFSVQVDKSTPKESFLSNIIKSMGADGPSQELASRIGSSRETFTNIMTFGTASGDQSLQSFSAILNSESRRGFYDQLTDYLADAVINLNNKEIRNE